MSARSFRSVFMVASCAGAALGCYLVSLRVASERAQLEDVESKIVVAQQDMRVLQTEIGTRGRLSQLERWNASALALSAPAANQFVSDGYELAKLTRAQPQADFHAPIVMASAPAPERKTPMDAQLHDDSGAPVEVADAAASQSLVHEASLKIEPHDTPIQGRPRMHSIAAPPAPEGAVSVASPPHKKSVDKPRLGAAKPVTRPVRLAKIDPLAPLPGKHIKTRESGSAR